MNNETVQQSRESHEARMSRDEVLSIDYHRNGIGGDGFYVALVRCHDDNQRVLVVIVPAWAVDGIDDEAAPASPGGGFPCFAIDPQLASGPWTHPGTIEFGVNSWRGDRYYDLVCDAAREYARSR